MNVQAMMKQVQKAQKQMEVMQKEIDETIFTATVGGVITVKMYGNKSVESIEIKEDAMDDAVELGEMITLATNNVIGEIDQITEEKIGGLTKGLKVPGMF